MSAASAAAEDACIERMKESFFVFLDIPDGNEQAAERKMQAARGWSMRMQRSLKWSRILLQSRRYIADRSTYRME